MIDWKKQKAGWVQEKAKDLEYLESIDYARLNKLVDAAAASGSARKIVEAHWELKKYESAVLKDRSSQIPLAQADEKIESLVIKYNAIAEKDVHNIKTNEKAKKNKFHSNYNSKTPNIEELMSISKDYSFYKQVLKEPDATIMKYYDFSLNISTIENEIKNIVSDYQNIQNNSELAGIKSRIEKYKDAIQKSRKKAPRKLLKGIHKAYNYENKDLEKLAKEIPRFEKEDFAKTKASAKRQISIAFDLIELLNRSDENDVYEILEAFTNESFQIDYKKMQNAIYFNNISKKFFNAVSELKKTVKETAEKYQEKLKADIRISVLTDIIGNESATDLENQKRILQKDLEDKIGLIDTINPENSVKDEYIEALKLIDNNVQQLKSEISRQKQATKEIDLLNKKLISTQCILKKKEKSYQTSQSKAQKTISELQKEKKELEQKLKEERSKKQALETDIQDIKKSVSDTQTKITGEVRRYVSAELKKIGDCLAQQEVKAQENNAAFSESLQTVSSNLDSAYSQLKDSIEKQTNMSTAKLNNMFEQINKKLNKTERPKEQISILQNLMSRFFNAKSDKVINKDKKSTSVLSTPVKTKKVAKAKKETAQQKTIKKAPQNKIKVNFKKALERKYFADVPIIVPEDNSNKSLPLINFKEALARKHG